MSSFPPPKSPPQLRVRASRTLVGTDGECAVVVLKGTPGTVGTAGVSKVPRGATRVSDDTDPDGYGIHVYWDMAVLNEIPDSNSLSAAWEMLETPADAVEFLGIRGG